MVYSTKLSQSLDAIRKLANPLDFAKIEELIGSVNESMQPHTTDLSQQSNMVDFLGVSVLGKTGTLSLFFNQNPQGEIQELSIRFTSSSSVGRDVETNILDLNVREIRQENITFLRPGKTFFVGSLSHKRHTRSNRDFEQLSNLAISVKREQDGRFTIVSNSNENNSISKSSVEESSCC